MHLSSLHPSGVALEAAQAGYERLRALATFVYPTLVLDDPEADDLVQSGLGHRMEKLTRFAQSGWESGVAIVDAREMLAEVCGVLCPEQKYANVPHAWVQPPRTAWGLVLRAVVARLRIDDGAIVPVSLVAWLASMTSEEVYAAINRGELTYGATAVFADSARAWLVERGIRGF